MRKSLWKFCFRGLSCWRRGVRSQFADYCGPIEIVHCYVNWDMDPLVAYLKLHPLPKTSCRPNISADAVETISLGMVQARGCSTCRISEATTHDKFQLMKLTLALLSDTDISGLPPACFTSVTINSNFACKLHVDKHIRLVEYRWRWKLHWWGILLASQRSRWKL